MSKVRLGADSPAKASAIALLLLMVLLGVFPLDVILPSFPALSAHFDTRSSDIALSISIFAIGVSISQFFLGPLSDQIGRKSLLIMGLMISILGAIGCANAVEFATFMIFRVLQALGCGCFVLSNALVQDIFSSEERDRVRILMTSASGLFISLSPLAGTLLQSTLGWTGSFYIFSLIAAAVLLHAVLTLPAPPEYCGAQSAMAQLLYIHPLQCAVHGVGSNCRHCIYLPFFVHRRFTHHLSGYL